MAAAATGAGADRALSKAELRGGKPDRDAFLRLPRQPITVVLDGVRQNYNLGAIFRLCDAFLVERLVVCGARVELHKRKLVQAARGTQRWVPWQQHECAIEAVTEAKAHAAWIVAVEQTTASVPPEQLAPRFPACLVLGSEERGISSEVVA
ncbi:MAG TPA: TrmH family RNA methyltransferase, partial [Rhizomicrobium sp.]|nr:TrmH family RNA methyltransferase [Rhizomicrobium sp.]